MNSLPAVAATMGGGFFVGILIGYALKKIVKIIAIVFGLFFAGIAYLQYQQIIDVNRSKLQTISLNTITTFMSAIPIFNASSHTTAFVFPGFGIPLTGAFSTGLAIGFMKG